MEIKPYKKLTVWQKSSELVKDIYYLTEQFPQEEKFGLAQQMRRSAVSIPSNIVEGTARISSKEKIQFFITARGSLSELDTQIEIIKTLPFTNNKSKISELTLKMEEISRMLNGLIKSRKKITTSLITSLLLIPLLLASSLFAGIGTTGAQFLKISPSVRPTAMGNAFVGLANDINAINYNPAGLSLMPGGEITFVHNQWIEEIKIEHFAFGQKIENFGTIGLAGTFTASGEIKKTNNTGTELNTTYAVNDTLFLVSYSKAIGQFGAEEDITVGGNIKYIQQKLEQEQTMGFGIDIGVLYCPAHMGLVIQNIGTPMKFLSQSDPLPANIKLGVGGSLLEGSLNLVMDIRYYFDGQSNVGLGIEYLARNIENVTLAIRTGYDTFYSHLGGLAGFSLGFGVYIGPGKLDFVWCPYGDNLGDTFRIGLTFHWDEMQRL